MKAIGMVPAVFVSRHNTPHYNTMHNVLKERKMAANHLAQTQIDGKIGTTFTGTGRDDSKRIRYSMGKESTMKFIFTMETP
jgi:hypothetical protein